MESLLRRVQVADKARLPQFGHPGVAVVATTPSRIVHEVRKIERQRGRSLGLTKSNIGKTRVATWGFCRRKEWLTAKLRYDAVQYQAMRLRPNQAKPKD